MAKRKAAAAKQSQQQLSLFTREEIPRAAPVPPPPPPPPTSATVTEQLPDQLITDGWRIVWRTHRHADGWFYAINERLGRQTVDHFYVTHRGYKFTIRDITKGKTTAIQEQEQ